MITLKHRPHTNPRKARDKYVQVRANGKWCSSKKLYLPKECPNCGTSDPDSFTFAQVEDSDERIERPGLRWFDYITGDVLRLCTCGRYYQTHYQYPRIAEGGYTTNGWPTRMAPPSEQHG